MAVKDRMRAYRARMRAAGMRPLQIWIPDTRDPAFAAECQRQSLLASAAEAQDADLETFMDRALDEALDGP